MNPALEPTQESPKQPEVLLGKFPYGWTGVEATHDFDGTPLEQPLPFPQFYRKAFTHPTGTVIVGAAKRGGFWEKFVLAEPPKYDQMPPEEQKRARRHYRRCLIRKNQCKPTRYIVWHDRSLRRIDKVLRQQFSKLAPGEQNRLVGQAAGLMQ